MPSSTSIPLLAGISISININPLLLMIPATLSASLAFMLPVATPPNAIVFGTNRLKIMELAKTGVFINFGAILLVTLFTYFFGTYIFDIDISSMPSWAIQ
ncbi:MAG: anion permease [Bacteroidota bacterium]|nr:anion permease [Bacteroidota bacterium]